MDYYSILGLKHGASDNDIKKAYRSLAMKHHPDRGGDEKKFKEISQAYEFLTDPEKKNMIDSGFDPANPHTNFRHHSGPFEFNFNAGNYDDVFSQFFGQMRQQNRSIKVAVNVTLEDVLTGKTVNAEINTDDGTPKIINIDIPAGVINGQKIRYPRMGEHLYKNQPPGDLIVLVVVLPHPVFVRDGDNLFIEKTISVWDAIIGTTEHFKTLDGKGLNISVPAGTQPETILSCRGEGLPNIHTQKRGNLMIKIKVSIPKNIDSEHLLKIQELKNEL